MADIIRGYNKLTAAVTKVPVIRNIGATVVVCVKHVDSINHCPLVAVSLLAIQPDLNARQLLNDLYNHRVGSLRAQPVSCRNRCWIAINRQGRLKIVECFIRSYGNAVEISLMWVTYDNLCTNNTEILSYLRCSSWNVITFVVYINQTKCDRMYSIKARFPLPKLTGGRFPLPVNIGRVDG